MKRKLSAIAAAVLAAALVTPITPGVAAPDGGAEQNAIPAVNTWSHTDVEQTTEPVGDGVVRQSAFYDVAVTPVDGTPDDLQESFVYMSVPRSGNDKIGYDDQDGAEFAADAQLTMSWSSFEYSRDVWVDVSLTTGQTIGSVDEVIIRPTTLDFEKQLIDSSTVRVKVPYSADGYRFSVEFDPQLITAYNDMSGVSGVLTTDSEGGQKVHTEPQNSMLVFANPVLTGADAERLIPTEDDGVIYRPAEGLVNDLDGISAEIVYFEPGIYYMGSDYHALLPENVKWVYLAPGAYVKGAFRFVHETQPEFKVTGRGVLSGEQYVYEADTTKGYTHSTDEKCHTTCVKMLQFESSPEAQHLEIEGITINEPPYHSFVVYAHNETGEISVTDFEMDVANYKQVGSWYWQTDGIELYSGSSMENTFFHANDDVLKMYHSNVTIDNTVIWKNENGPVIQWGWTPREIENVRVSNTDVIHNRMYWQDQKYNTCLFNSSTHWEDMGARDRADTTMTIKNMTFENTRVEGALNCAIRLYALSNMENIVIDGLEIDEWNDLPLAAQENRFEVLHNTAGEKVTVGNEMDDREGLLIRNYSVDGTPILKSGNNWADTELGRIGFAGALWENWNVTGDSEPTGVRPTLTLEGLEDNSIASARELIVRGSTNAESVDVRVNGVNYTADVKDGKFSVLVELPDITNKIVVTAVAADGAFTVERRNITALGTHIGSVADPVGDDYGPGSYRYPSDGAFNSSSFDLTRLDVYEDADLVRFVVAVEGDIRNPWGGNGMSTQRVHLYLRDRDSDATTQLLPGSNMSAEGAWRHAIVLDGRTDNAGMGIGVYGPDHERVADVDMQVDPAGEIIGSVPATLFDGVDLAEAGYQVSMFSSSEAGEGTGGIRPVYSTECVTSGPCMGIAPWRFSGGAGEVDDSLESKDTDTSDPNAIDIIAAEGVQEEVLDWTRGAVVVPYVELVVSSGPDDGSEGDTEDNSDDGSEDGSDGSSGGSDVPDGVEDGPDDSSGGPDGSDSGAGSSDEGDTGGSDTESGGTDVQDETLSSTGVSGAFIAASIVALLLVVGGLALHRSQRV